MSALDVVDNVVCKKAKKRIAARQQLLHSSVVITAVMNLMEKKLMLMSGSCLSTKMREDINLTLTSFQNA